ncbi:MAG: MATE family efflux transporter [Eubacteriales bacterium]|nr:MATE family efflux transporter [Eubacteriales bacterium]
MEEGKRDGQPLFTGRQLLALVVPLVLEQILGLTVGMADSVMVSSAGEAAVSGVSLVDSINILLTNLFASLATGGTVIAARRLGENRREAAVSAADQLLFLVTGIAAVVALFSILSNRFLLGLIFGHVEEAVMNNAVIYFYITAVSFPFLAVYNASAALSRAMGDSRSTMLVSVLMNVVNIAGNAVLILAFQAGVYGVAASTLVSRILGAAVMFCMMRNPSRRLHYSRHPFRPLEKGTVEAILRIGVPTGLDNCIFQVGKILLQSLIAGLGTVAIAANAIVGVVAGVAVIPASAMGIAMITVVSQTLGAGQREQARRYVKKMMGYSYLFMILLNVLLILFSPQIAGLYQVSEQTIVLAARLIAFHSVCAMLLWPTGFSLPNALRAAMDANYTMAVSLGCMWVCRIGCSYLFVLGLDMGLWGIWAAMAVDWVVRSAFFVWRIASGRWLLHEKIPD